MKTLIALLAITSTLSATAQIKAGRITYETEIKNYYNTEAFDGKKSEPDTFATSSTYTIDFNERYIRTFIGMDELLTDYISIQDKSTGKIYFATLTEEDKTIHFIDLDRDYIDDPDPEYYNDYEEQKPDLDHYHEGFYMDLLRMPVNDTVVIATDETKEILGFTCKKYIMKIKSQTITLWATNEVTGIEQSYNFPKQITGLILELYLKEKKESLHTIATVFSTQTTLTNDNIAFVPEGYTLSLGTLYVDSYDIQHSINPYALQDNPGFITEPSDYTKVMQSICKEIDNAISPALKKEYHYAFAEVLITIDEKGKITLVASQDAYEYSEGMENKPDIDYKKLAKNIEKNYSFSQPFQLSGKPVTSTLTLSYSYSDYGNE